MQLLPTEDLGISLELDGHLHEIAYFVCHSRLSSAKERKRPRAPSVRSPCELQRGAVQGKNQKDSCWSWDFSTISYRMPKLWLYKISVRQKFSRRDNQRRLKFATLAQMENAPVYNAWYSDKVTFIWTGRWTNKMYDFEQQNIRISSRRKEVTASAAMSSHGLIGPFS